VCSNATLPGRPFAPVVPIERQPPEFRSENYLDRVATMPLLRSVAERSLNPLHLSPGQRVLDVGCGSGVFLPQLADRVGSRGHVVGLDHAAAFVEVARSRVADLQNVTVEGGDALALPFADASFDAAHCERVLMHLSDPLRAIREMRRVVKPGGWIVAAEPDWGGLQICSSDPSAAARLLARWTRTLAQPRMGLELRGEMVRAGLVEVNAAPIVPGVTDFNELRAYGLDLERSAAELHADRTQERSRSVAVLDEWADETTQGAFFGYIGVFVIAGRVPGQVNVPCR
jgi:SAM-dependent methyltransferase